MYLRFVVHDIFADFDAWKYEDASQKHEIGRLSLEIFTDILNFTGVLMESVIHPLTPIPPATSSTPGRRVNQLNNSMNTTTSGTPSQLSITHRSQSASTRIEAARPISLHSLREELVADILNETTVAKSLLNVISSGSESIEALFAARHDTQGSQWISLVELAFTVLREVLSVSSLN